MINKCKKNINDYHGDLKHLNKNVGDTNKKFSLIGEGVH